MDVEEGAQPSYVTDPRYQHAARSIEGLPETVVCWCEAQRAAGVEGPVVFWRGSMPATDLIEGPSLDDAPAVFARWLELAIVEKRTDSYAQLEVLRDVNMGVLVMTPGKPDRIVSGVAMAVRSAEAEHTKHWDDVAEWHQESAYERLRQSLLRHCNEDRPEPVKPPREFSLSGEDGKWAKWLDLARFQHYLPDVGLDVRCGFFCDIGFAILVDPTISLVRTPEGKWRLDDADQIIAGSAGRTLNLSAFTWGPSELRQFARMSDGLGAKTDKEFLFGLMRQWYAYSEVSSLFEKAMQRREKAAISFVADGWAPRGMVTLFAAETGTGKSTLLHDLVLKVGTPPDQRDGGGSWLDVPDVDLPHGTAVMISGEDMDTIIDARAECLDPSSLSLRGMCLDQSGMSLDDVIRYLDGVPDLVLVVIDPVRKFLIGSEDDSGPVSIFFDKLEGLARRKNCAVLPTHHLRKNSGVRGLTGPQGVASLIRGSQVFRDRPRSVIVMQKKGAIVSVAVANHNIPPPYRMATESRTFNTNSETLKLTLTGSARLVGSALAAPPAESALVPSAEVEAVFTAMTEMTADGGRVTRTGKRELFDRRLAALENIPRSRVRRAVEALIASGRLRTNEAGAIECVAVQTTELTASLPLPMAAE